MVYFPDEDSDDDPPNRQSQLGTPETPSLEEKLGAAVVRHLQDSPALEVWYDGDKVRIDPIERRSERKRTRTEASSPRDRESDRRTRNRKTASNSLSGSTGSTTDSGRSIDREGQSRGLNGELNVQNLTEKQAKAYLLLEVTGGEISASQLAERTGYSSKGGAYNAREKWEQDRGLDESR